MTAYETISYDLTDGVATIKLDRPDSLNSLNKSMRQELRHAFERAPAEGARAILMTGEGRSFCSGQDLGEHGGGLPNVERTLREEYEPMLHAILDSPLPVICAVNGVAAGAGANIALACDIVMAAENAKFIQSFANIGLIPDSGGTWVLPRLIGQARAMAITLTGEPVTAPTAQSWGMIYKSVPADELMETATKLTVKLASGPTKGLAETKKRIRESTLNTLQEELDMERDAMRMLGYSQDYAEGVAAFLEKRSPTFTGQ